MNHKCSLSTDSMLTSVKWTYVFLSTIHIQALILWLISQSKAVFMKKRFYHFFAQRIDFKGILKAEPECQNSTIADQKKREVFKLLAQLWHEIKGNLCIGIYLHHLLFSVSFADIFFSTVSVNISHEEERTCLVHRNIYLNPWTCSVLWKYFCIFILHNLNWASMP